MEQNTLSLSLSVPSHPHKAARQKMDGIIYGEGKMSIDEAISFILHYYHVIPCSSAYKSSGACASA